MNDLKQQEIDRLKTPAFLKKMADIEKINGYVTEQETGFWSAPENLQRLATEFWHHIQLSYYRFMRWSMYALVLIFASVGYIRIAGSVHRNLLYKTLLLACSVCTLLMIITTVDWVYEAFPEKYWFQASLVTIAFGLITWGISNMAGAVL